MGFLRYVVEADGSMDSPPNSTTFVEMLEEGANPTQGTTQVGMPSRDRPYVGELEKGLLAHSEFSNLGNNTYQRFSEIEGLDVVGTFVPTI